MTKLLYAEFSRLFHSLIFKAGVLFSAGLSIFIIFMRWLDVTQNPEFYHNFPVSYRNADGLIFVGGIYLIFVLAIFIGEFIGREYSDGTIRNKLVCGHTRRNIYLSKLIVCSVACLIFHLLYILVSVLMGILLIDGTTMTIGQLMLSSLAGSFAMTAITALMLFISMLIPHKAAGSVCCLLLALLMMFGSLTIYERLQSEEYYDAYTYTDEDTGISISVDRQRNPHYPTGIRREIYEFLNEYLPFSQLYSIVIMESEFDLNGIWIVYDCITILLVSGAGAIIFKRKDLH